MKKSIFSRSVSNVLNSAEISWVFVYGTSTYYLQFTNSFAISWGSTKSLLSSTAFSKFKKSTFTLEQFSVIHIDCHCSSIFLFWGQILAPFNVTMSIIYVLWNVFCEILMTDNWIWKCEMKKFQAIQYSYIYIIY